MELLQIWLFWKSLPSIPSIFFKKFNILFNKHKTNIVARFQEIYLDTAVYLQMRVLHAQVSNSS